MKPEIYQSSTHGNIPLSFTGRRLLANEREAAEYAIAAGSFAANDMALSKARGALAEYMSKLEGNLDVPQVEIFGVDLSATRRDPHERAATEFLQAAHEFNEARDKLLRTAEQCTDLGLKPTWANPSEGKFSKCPVPWAGKPKRFTPGRSFPELTFEVSRVVKTERVTVDEHVEVMGREPK